VSRRARFTTSSVPDQNNGLGQSTCSASAATVRGMNFIDVLELFEKDPQTEGIIMVARLAAATKRRREYIRRNVTKPVSPTSGRHGPRQRMGQPAR